MSKAKITGFMLAALLLLTGTIVEYEITQKGSFYQQLTPHQKELADSMGKMVVNPLYSIEFLSNLLLPHAHL